jgi:hypothetical protein
MDVPEGLTRSENPAMLSVTASKSSDVLGRECLAYGYAERIDRAIQEQKVDLSEREPYTRAFFYRL